MVETGLLGYPEFEPGGGKDRAVRLATDGAKFGGGKFGVAVKTE